MKRKFTFLIAAAFMLLTMMATTGRMWGQTKGDYSVTYNYSALENMLSGSYLDASSYWKVPGTAGNSATISIPITHQPDSDITITFNIATFGSGADPSDKNTTITAVGTETNSNWTGSTVSTYPTSSSYVNGVMTITKPDNPTNLGSITITMGVNTGVKIFRLKSITVSYEYSGSLQPSDLVLTGAPIELEFDLYNSSDAQVINYTTSSTGAVTVSTNNYVTTEVNANDKTITVTPTAVTPSVQTITVNQAADATYASGSVTFTVSISDTTPFNGVIFDATKDTGTSPIVKDNVSLACSNGLLDNNTEYRFYKNSTTTISTTDGNKITQIEFTGVSGNPVSNFTNQAGWTTSGNDGVWEGEAESVSFVASVAQVRATMIKVTVEQNTEPSITASNPDELAYDATSGSINYTINNYVEGAMSASTEAEWITNFTYQQGENGTVGFSTSTNPTATQRSATVTLTYTYNTNETVTKVVTVTQAHFVVDYATLPFNWDGGTSATLTAITGVTANGLGTDYGDNNAPYRVKFDTDGDYIQVKTDSQPAKVIIGVKMIGGASTSKITVKASADGITFDNGEELTISGAQNDILNLQTTRSFGADVRFVRMVFTKGSNVGVGPITITKYTTDPIINAEDVNIACDATNGSIAYTISNPVDGGILTAAITAGNVGDWLTLGSVTTSVAFTCTANTEEENRTATVTLTYTYNTSETVTKDVTVTQSRRDFALLPFAYDGNGSGVLPCGLTQEGVGTYNTEPKMKFDDTGDYLLLKLNDTPVSISYDIKGNTFSGGTFKVQVSVNGADYTDIESYTQIVGNIQTVTLLNSVDNVKYIKWVYTNKANGNVALGNLNVTTEMIINGDCTVDDVTISNTEVLTVEAGSVMTVTGTLTNQGDASHLVIEEGGQLVVPTDANVQATVKKAVGHTAKSTGDWYTISSPVNNIAPNDVTNLIQATATNYDFYYYNEPSGEWFNHKAAGHAVSNMTNGRGYLYWNAGGEELAFAGELNTGNVNVAVTADGSGDLAGINLIGNPYSHNIYKGDGTAIPNAGASLVTGFYVLSNSDSWVACTDNTTAIKPGQGILVKTTTGGTVQMTNTTSKGTAKAGNDNIRFTVANNQYEDVAYALFKNEIGLDKINHRNAEVPMLYIPQDGINYAIATMSDDVEMFTLSFKTVTTSKYTLSVKLDGRYDYLHIIDRLTGEDVDMLVEGEYSFMGTPKDLVDRFIVKLKYDANINDVNDIFAYQSGSDVIVNGEGELQIFDLMGRKVMTQTVNGVQTVNVPAQGVYIFRLNGKVQKIVVK